MRRQTLVAVLTAACCGAVSCGDTFSTLTEPMCRLRSEFLPRALFVPSLGRNRAGSSAACKCASYTLAGKPAILEPTNARCAMLQSFVGGSFWEQVESSCLTRRVRAHETALALTMRKTSIGSKKISLSPTKSVMKPFVSEKPSHQVLVLNASYEPLSIVSATRALSLLWEGKASSVVTRATWTSAGKKFLTFLSGGYSVDVPSIVSLRKYINPPRRRPPLNRKTILMRDLGQCQYCDKPAENIDHIIPRCRGGGNTWENCVASCRHCNSRKGASYLKDVPNMKLRRLPGPPQNLSWVHAAVWKVDPRWKPYIGDLSWEMIDKKLKEGAKKHKPIKAKKSVGASAVQGSAALPAAKDPLSGDKAMVAAVPAAPDGKLGAVEAESIIAAYTGGK